MVDSMRNGFVLKMYGEKKGATLCILRKRPVMML